MKNLLLPLLVALALTSFSQTKKASRTRYFKCEVEYTIDCGSGTSIMETTWMRGTSPSYDELYYAFKKWVFPHKVKEFSIVNLKETAKTELWRLGEKFECTSVVKDTVKFSRASLPSISASNFHFYDVVYWSTGNAALKIEKNNDSMRTVTFSLKNTHFINDSTFVFKLLTK